MLLYFAGAEAYIKFLIDEKIDNVLTSYFSIQKSNSLGEFKKFKSVFLDSGGFTARKLNIDLDIKGYADFLLKNPHFTVYANVDLNESEKTIANQKALEAMGLKPIPVFHYEEWQAGKHDLFDFYIKNYSYIALGGVAGKQNSNVPIMQYLDYCFLRTQDKIKVHGFGMTAMYLLKRYPFYSVDSTTWLAGARYGTLMRKFSVISGSTSYYRDEINPIAKVLTTRQRLSRNLKLSLDIEKRITELWIHRGIDWSKK